MIVSILFSMVRVENHPWVRRPLGESSLERFLHNVFCQMILKHPADDLAIVDIHHSGQIHPVLPRPYISDIRDPQLIEVIGRKVSPHKVLCEGIGMNRLSCHTKLLCPEGFYPVYPHEASHSVFPTTDSLTSQIFRDPRRSVSTAMILIGSRDHCHQSLVLFGPSPQTSFQVSIVPAPVDTRHLMSSNDSDTAFAFQSDVFTFSL